MRLTITVLIGLGLSFYHVAALAKRSDYQVPDSIKEQYRGWYQLPVTTAPDGTESLGPARHFIRKGIHVLYLQGDRFEMAYQHGRLLKDEIYLGAVPDAAVGFGNTVMQTLGVNPFSRLATKFLYHSIMDKMFQHAIEHPVNQSANPLAEGYGLSEGSGLDFHTIMYGALSAEATTVLLGNNLKGKTFNLGGSSPSQCSSFVAWGEATSTGEVMIGRNTDYWLNGTYDRFPTVIYFNPTDGTQKYMAVTSAGLHNAGIVAANESGIWLDVHTVPTKDVSAEGIPAFMIAQEVLRSSKDFETALANFQKAKPGAGWTYLLVSLKEKKAATIELSATGIGIRRAESDTLIQTNHYLTAEMSSRFEAVNPSVYDDTRARYLRISNMLADGRGKLDERRIAEILGDKWDALNQKTRWFGNTVAVHTTMTSAVVDAAKNRVYVANGTAPVSQTEYVELPLVTMDPDNFSLSSFDSFKNDQFKLAHPEMAQAEQYFIQAKIAFEKELDPAKSEKLLGKAFESDPGAWGVLFLQGLLSIKQKEWARAIDYLNRLNQASDPHYQALSHFYLGRIYSANREAKNAENEFNVVLQLADPQREEKLISSTRTALDKLHQRGHIPFRALDLPIMFQEADVISYK